MNLNHFPYSETRIQDYWREYRQSADFYGLPAKPGIGQMVRENTGKALISLGAWIMPRRKHARGEANGASHLTAVWGNR